MTLKSKIKEKKRAARHERIRRNIAGTAEKPRLCVHRSLNNLQAQIVDDISGKIVLGISTLNKDLRGKLKSGGNVEAAVLLGKALAQAAKKKGIQKVCFDRGGYLYHGRVKAFADAAREGGLEF